MITPEQQRDIDLSEIKIKVIDNAILVRLGPAWLSFATWDEASANVGERIATVYKERAARKTQEARG